MYYPTPGTPFPGRGLSDVPIFGALLISYSGSL